MNDPINVNRFQNKIRALFGMRGDNPVPTLKELLPVVVVENDRPEMKYAGREMLYWRSLSSPAAAAFVSQVVFKNPIDSGVLAVIESVIVTFAVAIETFFWMTATDAPISARGFVRDLRIARGDVALAVASACGLYQLNNELVGGSGQGPIYPIERDVQHFPLNIILPPGTNISVKGNTINTRVDVGYRWYERQLERGVES